MRGRTTRHLVLLVAMVVLLSGCDWQMFGYEPDGSRSSPDTTISTANVASLTLKFRWSPSGLPPNCSVDDVWSPVVANGIAYADFSVGITNPFEGPPCDVVGDGVAAFNATTGASVWTQFTGGEQYFPNLTEHAPAVANGIVYDNDTNGNLNAFNAATGQRLWTARTYFGSAPSVADGVVYVAAGDQRPNFGDVYAFDGTTGALLWDAPVPNVQLSVPAYANGVVYVGGTFSGTEYALNAWNGATIWTANTNESLGSSAVVNGIVYINAPYAAFPTFTAGNQLDALNATTGARVWTARTAAATGGVAATDGLVYAAAANLPLYALNAWNGAAAWTATVHSAGIPAVANGIVYIGSFDASPNPNVGISSLHAFNATTGAALWTATTGAFRQAVTGATNTSSPVVANGFVYMGSSDGNVYAFGLP